MTLKKSQKSLKDWTKQKWRTKSGKPSAKTGERYLPEKAIKALSKKEYAATTKKKREDTKNHGRLTADVGATDRSRAVSYRGLSRDRGNREGTCDDGCSNLTKFHCVYSV